ncbi:CBS domain-containing protein, partial [Lujinxingia vulgaris]
VAFRLFGRSIFDVQLLKRGCDLARGRDGAILSHTCLTDYMVTDYPRCDRKDSLGSLRARLREQSWDTLFVTDAAGQYLGTITARHILEQESECTADETYVRSPVIFDETTSIRAAMDSLINFLNKTAPVISTQNGRLIGVAPEGVVISAYLDISRELRREENEAA